MYNNATHSNNNSTNRRDKDDPDADQGIFTNTS